MDRIVGFVNVERHRAAAPVRYASDNDSIRFIALEGREAHDMVDVEAGRLVNVTAG